MTTFIQFKEKVNCDACMYSIEHEDEDKWADPIVCGKCGRSKKELIELEKEHWEISKERVKRETALKGKYDEK